MKSTLIVMLWLLGLGALAGACHRLHATRPEATNRSTQPDEMRVSDHHTAAGRARIRRISFGTEEKS